MAVRELLFDKLFLTSLVIKYHLNHQTARLSRGAAGRSTLKTMIVNSCGEGLESLLNQMKHAAVFLDRDGTMIEERHYLSRPEEVAVFPRAAAALKRLLDAGLKLFIVSNQSGVGRGYFTLADVDLVHAHLSDLFLREGVRFERIYIAPEAPDAPSRGRKPSPQYLFDARDEFGIDLARSYMVGDKLIDLECGWNAGIRRSVLVRTGYGARTEQESPEGLGNAVVVDDLSSASDWILRDLEAGA
jgi:D-glycero-D-manno-heptose 1,7-bisphosphate phosphatase